MSEIVFYVCNNCKHEVIIGFVGGDTNRTVAICTTCSDQFHVHPAIGEALHNSNKPYILAVRGKKWVEVYSKKGRMKKTVSQDAWIDSGIRIPVHEDVVEWGDDLRIVYDLVFDDVSCPTCQTKGSLLEYFDYVKHCPQCKTGAMY